MSAETQRLREAVLRWLYSVDTAAYRALLELGDESARESIEFIAGDALPNARR